MHGEKLGVGNGRSGLGGSSGFGTICMLYTSGAAALHDRERRQQESRELEALVLEGGREAFVRTLGYFDMPM